MPSQPSAQAVVDRSTVALVMLVEDDTRMGAAQKLGEPTLACLDRRSLSDAVITDVAVPRRHISDHQILGN
jgi:hypothetical protein